MLKEFASPNMAFSLAQEPSSWFTIRTSLEADEDEDEDDRADGDNKKNGFDQKQVIDCVR